MDYMFIIERGSLVKDKQERYSFIVDGVELRIVIQALVQLKNKQIEEGKSHDFLDDLIIRACDAKPHRFKQRGVNETR